MTTRRVLVASVLALAAAPAAAADRKSVEVGKAFPYLENYWKLPAGERSRFALAYYLKRDGKTASGLSGTIIHAGARTPFRVGAGGRVATLPTLAQIRGKAKLEFDLPESTRFSMSMVIEPMARPAAEMGAADLAATVVQAARGARKVAGLMGLAMPPITAVLAKGVASGVAVHADGRTTALPLRDGLVVFEPGKLKTARTVRFPKVPSQLVLGPADD